MQFPKDKQQALRRGYDVVGFSPKYRILSDSTFTVLRAIDSGVECKTYAVTIPPTTGFQTLLLPYIPDVLPDQSPLATLRNWTVRYPLEPNNPLPVIFTRLLKKGVAIRSLHTSGKYWLVLQQFRQETTATQYLIIPGQTLQQGEVLRFSSVFTLFESYHETLNNCRYWHRLDEKSVDF